MLYATEINLAWNAKDKFALIMDFPDGTIKDYPVINTDVKVFDAIYTFGNVTGIVINAMIAEARSFGWSTFKH